MNLFKSLNMLFSAGDNYIRIESRAELRVITVIGKKWCHLGAGVQGVVVRKFSNREKFGPVVLVVI